MAKKQTILYCSHIDWAWIKQRPQFLAESLSEKYRVIVRYKKQRQRALLTEEMTNTAVELRPYQTLPALEDDFWPLTRLNLFLRKQNMKRLLQQTQAEYLWLCHPTQYYEVPLGYTKYVIYDCMDDQLQLDCPKAWKPRIRQAEYRLVMRANLILISSRYLMQTLLSRYPALDKTKLLLIRNACCDEFQRIVPSELPQNGSRKIAGYIGTISYWIDFSAILKSLEEFPELEYWMLGPVACENVPQHPRIHYCGVVSHEKLADYVRRMDFLVMPFLVNEIIKAVDPVKIYEYIAFDRAILCTDYAEVHHFDGFALYYCGEEEYCKKIGTLLQNTVPPYSHKAAQDFLAKNTWQCRTQQIIERIELLTQKGKEESL